MDTPRDQRIPVEVATYLKRRFRPKPQQGKHAKEMRWVTICHTFEPTEDSAPKYSDWEASSSPYVAIDILTHADGIRHSGFEGEPVETATGVLVLVACALQYLHKRGKVDPTADAPPPSRSWQKAYPIVRFGKGPCSQDYARSCAIPSATRMHCLTREA